MPGRGHCKRKSILIIVCALLWVCVFYTISSLEYTKIEIVVYSRRCVYVWIAEERKHNQNWCERDENDVLLVENGFF